MIDKDLIIYCLLYFVYIFYNKWVIIRSKIYTQAIRYFFMISIK